MPLKVGSKAPPFTSLDQNNHPHSLTDYCNHWLLLYFYPRDNTPGCTTEACGLRDNFSQLSKHLTVIGVSADTAASHQKFATKHQLPFTLLSDTDKSIVKAYQVWAPKKFMGREYMGIQRISYLIDPDGIIQKVYQKVKPADHAREVLKDIKDILK